MDLAKQDAAGANCECLALHKSCCKCHHAGIKTFTLSKGCCKYWSCCTCTKTLPMSFSILLPFYTKPACQKASKVGARLCFCGRAVLQSDYDTTRFTLTDMVQCSNLSYKSVTLVEMAEVLITANVISQKDNLRLFQSAVRCSEFRPT